MYSFLVSVQLTLCDLQDILMLSILAAVLILYSVLNAHLYDTQWCYLVLLAGSCLWCCCQTAKACKVCSRVSSWLELKSIALLGSGAPMSDIRRDLLDVFPADRADRVNLGCFCVLPRFSAIVPSGYCFFPLIMVLADRLATLLLAQPAPAQECIAFSSAIYGLAFTAWFMACSIFAVYRRIAVAW